MDSFVDNPLPDTWNELHSQYNQALQLKAQSMKTEKKETLLKLDKWFQTELPECIQKRTPKHITHFELHRLMQWKLTRGKFRPRLTEMVQTNSEEDVVSASTKAFQALPDVSAAIKALTVLKAVGPATASAVLAAGAPEKVAFMADESISELMAGCQIKYDLPFYTKYMKRVSQMVNLLNKAAKEKCWSPHKVELTLWTFHILRTKDNEMLEKLLDPSNEQSNSRKFSESNSDENSTPPKRKLKT